MSYWSATPGRPPAPVFLQGTTDGGVGFTTGSNATGYTLTSIELDIDTITSGYDSTNFVVSIWSSKVDGTHTLPDSSLHTLTNPSTLATGLSTFTASSVTLTKDTTYFVVVDDGVGSSVTLNRTSATDEDSDKATGWSIGNLRYFNDRTATGFTTTSSSGNIFAFKVNGSARAADNTPATGDPTISGTTTVGNLLTADTSDIADDDGLDNVSYSYQWIRVDADGTSNPTDIGTDSTIYALVADDEGKKIKVTVTFDDDLDNEEERTSALTDEVAAADVILVSNTRDRRSRPHARQTRGARRRTVHHLRLHRPRRQPTRPRPLLPTRHRNHRLAATRTPTPTHTRRAVATEPIPLLAIASISPC